MTISTLCIVENVRIGAYVLDELNGILVLLVITVIPQLLVVNLLSW